MNNLTKQNHYSATVPSMPRRLRPPPLSVVTVLFLVNCCSGLDFLFNSFNLNGTGLVLVNNAQVDPPVLRLTDDAIQYSYGRAFSPSRLSMTNSTDSTLSSFSTSFVFSILPEIPTSPGFGLCFVLTNYSSPPNALASQYFGLFSNATLPSQAPLLAVEFDTGQNPEFNDPDDNHVGIDLNNIDSVVKQTAGYYNSTGGFVPLRMRSGRNIRAWIEFDGPNFQINVTIAPVGVPRPSLPLLSFKDPVIANYVSTEMFVGFSASKTTWIEQQRVLAWSFSDTGTLREINTTNFPVFSPASSSSSLPGGAIAGIAIGSVVFLAICGSGFYLIWRRNRLRDEEDEIEEWELEYWPHRFSYEELAEATGGFSEDNLLGSGGFGKVYKGTLPNKTELAVKCVNHDSKQGLREFMAEISSMGRLQHKNLVQMRGWCRKGNQLMLVYDYMPNGSLNNWIFDKPKNLLRWEDRRRVLADVAEGLSYLHQGWEQVVVHRDIKSSNVLLDGDMRGRLGDFGLAKLYGHGEVPGTTRVVGTLGYLAPELATVAAPTAGSDVYGFGVVVLEVVCGRRPIELAAPEEEVVLVDLVRELYGGGRVCDAADPRMEGEYQIEEMEMMLKLGLTCCHPLPDRRPTMREVVAVLLGEDAAAPTAALLTELARGGVVEDGGGSESQELERPLTQGQPPDGVV